jgi:hypothetical protein
VVNLGKWRIILTRQVDQVAELDIIANSIEEARNAVLDIKWNWMDQQVTRDARIQFIGKIQENGHIDSMSSRNIEKR